MAAWIPSNFAEACKRNAGRRKLHLRKREARANRLIGMLATADSVNARELRRATYRSEGYPKAVGDFPFDTRRQETEESYCGFTQSSWHHTTFISQMSPRELMRAYGRVVRTRDRRQRANVEQMKSEVKQAVERWLG